MRPWPYFRLLTIAGAALMAAGTWTPVRGQDADDLQRAVARISFMEGEVSVRRGDDATEWVAGVINAPLLSGDRISTAPNSRAEVQLDAANVLRIGGNAEIHLAQLEYGRYQLELAHGTVTFSVVRASGANVELDTPSVSVRPSKVGVYRISVNDGGETQVSVRAGDLEIFTPRGSQWIATGQTMIARGNAADPEYQIVAALAPDDWDRWNQSRDQMVTRSVSYKYVPEGVYGSEELDSAGQWAPVDNYGYCWRPTAVDAGWAPYSRGRWVWEDWYGWTWVSYDPWGWAPYHYGRWFWHANSWWWYPGVFGRPHYWSPALVGFFGFGTGGVAFGFGNVGWVPLAPYETFHPWWGHGYYAGGFNHGINITNVNITNVYQNARVGRGISAVSASDFQAGRFRNVARYSGDQVREAGVVRGAMPLSPSRSNLRFADRSAGYTPQSRNVSFFRNQQPTTAQRTPFAQQQRSFEQSVRGGAGGAAAAQRGGFGGSNAAAGRVEAPGRIAQGGVRTQESPANVSPRGAENPGANGWRRFGGSPGQNGEVRSGMAPQSRGGQTAPNSEAAPSRGATRNEAPANQAPANRGWQRFGEPGSAPRQNFGASPRSNEQPPAAARSFGDSRSASPRADSQSFRVSPPVVRERQAQPRSYEAPRYQAPQSQAPRYSAPRSAPAPTYSAPSYSAPRGGGGSFSSPRSSSGGGGGGSRGNSGGGGHSSSGGGHSGGERNRH
jgi:hypothetical protein